MIPEFDFKLLPPEHAEGWWTNFSPWVRPAYELLVARYTGPGKAVIKDSLNGPPDGSLWIEPPPANWQEVGNAVRATGFWEEHNRLYKLQYS